MKLMSVILSSSVVLMLAGCAQTGGIPEVDSAASKYVLTSQSGMVTDVRAVVVKDEGGGGFLGAIVGGVLGSTLGAGNGKTLATLGGGLIGMYAGNEIGKSNAQELSVKADDGQEAVVISKGTAFVVGQRVKIIKRDGRFYSVAPTQ
jgi:outer membrane lipoprotein SlyB